MNADTPTLTPDDTFDAIEVLDCTPEAVASLDAVPAWSKR